MEILDGGEPLLYWDRNLSELSEPGEGDTALYNTHFSGLLDDFSQEALLGQLLSDPFLSDRAGAGDGDEELAASPAPPHIQAEHSYSLCGDSRPQSPLSHLPGEGASDGGDPGGEDWPMETEDGAEPKPEPLLCPSPGLLPALALTVAPQGPPPALPLRLAPPGQLKTAKVKEDADGLTPQIKLEPHEVDQFLNLSPKGLESLHMPPTPPSSHGSDSEGGQSPTRSCAPASPAHSQAVLKVAPRGPSSLTNSPLLTAPHKLQGTGPLILTEEEKRTLIAEGYPVPTKLPLSKAEEKALKKIRRKIKNKISAQESRRKKKEYMDALEKKVETCSNENSELRRKVETLESTNKSLLQQLHCLQAVVAGKVPLSCRVIGTQTTTCLMVAVLCFAVFLGSFSQSFAPCSSAAKTGLPGVLTAQESYTATVKSRSLLGYEERSSLDEPHPSGLSVEHPEAWGRRGGPAAAWPSAPDREPEGEGRGAEPGLPYLRSNETHAAQKSVLIELHPRRSHPELRDEGGTQVIDLERTVNETS
ncbi:cyclic AMP-responsive element-binding protein 3-like protein 2 [Lepisosteus oculatus]